MRIAERGIKEDVGDAGAADVQRLGGHIGEDYASRVDAASGRLGTDARLAVGREAQKPEHGVGHATQDVAPGGEGLWVVFVELVGAGVDYPVLRQTHLCARRQVGLVQHVLRHDRRQHERCFNNFIFSLFLTRDMLHIQATCLNVAHHT